MLAIAIGLALAALVTGPAWWQGGYVGSPGAEVYGHAWVQAWAADAWPAWPTGTHLAAGAASWPILDGLPTWLAAGLAQVVGLRVAWNLLVVASIVLAAFGGARLAGASGGDPRFGALAVPLMPIWLGSITSGLTEDLAIGLLALAVAAGLEGRWVKAGILAGVLAFCGLYLAWFAGVALAVLGLRALAQSRDRWRGTLGGALLAGALVSVAAAPFASQLGEPTPARPRAPAAEPLWALNPWRGADAVSFVAVGKVDTDGAVVREHPTYLGYSTIGLAAVGGGPAGWAAVAGCALASMGDEVSVAGKATGLHNPVASLLHMIPMGDRFRNHARIMLLGQLVLVTMAARGAARLARSRRPLAGFAAVVMALEVILASPGRAPAPVTPAESPAIYAELFNAPAGLPVRVVGAHNPQAPLFDQRAHGRVLRNGPNRPDPGRPRPDEEIVVAFGEAVARLHGELGPPDATVADAAAWWP
ncbi:MAG: hypothetical protein EXR72_15185 [Myxococcales bacterium]|nr:hypothetical protein [Myxococcales bacterium]